MNYFGLMFSFFLPGAVLAMMEEKGATEEQAVDALFVAAAVGQAIATQASISGAEGGCQAECGSAAAMAAFLPVSLPTSFHAATQVGLYKKPISWWSTSTLRAMRSAKLST